LFRRPEVSRPARTATLAITIRSRRRTRSAMDATWPNGTAHRRWAALSRTTSRLDIRQRVIPATQRRTGWARRSTTLISRSHITIRCARTATRFRPTTHNLHASIAIQTRRRTGPECRTRMSVLHLRRAGTELPSAITATRMAGAEPQYFLVAPQSRRFHRTPSPVKPPSHCNILSRNSERRLS